MHVPIEFVPTSHRYVLTVMCAWWALGDMLASLVSNLKYHCFEYAIEYLTRLRGH